MKVNTSDSVNTSYNSINNSSTSYTANSVKSTGSVADTVKSDSSQKSKDWSQANTKNISQLSEYEKENMPVSERVVIEAIQKANKAIMGGNRRFEFSIHEETNEIVVKVFDSDTNELVREIPNEKILDMVAKICEMAGIFVDERR